MPKDQKTDIWRFRRRWMQVAMGALIAPRAFAAPSGLEVGREAPRPDVKLIDGNIISGRQLQGKAVVYLFWATWCPVCVAEIAHYEALRNKYKERGLEVLALSLDEEPGAVKAFRARNPYTLPMAMRSDALREVFGNIRGTPTILFVDRAGLLRLKHLGPIAPDELEYIVTLML